MAELFIPPEGAMQFEITHIDTPFKGESFWVTPHRFSVGFSHGWPQCNCDVRFEAILETVSPRLSKVLRGNDRVVCRCVGRLIE